MATQQLNNDYYLQPSGSAWWVWDQPGSQHCLQCSNSGDINIYRPCWHHYYTTRHGHRHWTIWTQSSSGARNDQDGSSLPEQLCGLMGLLRLQLVHQLCIFCKCKWIAIDCSSLSAGKHAKKSSWSFLLLFIPFQLCNTYCHAQAIISNCNCSWPQLFIPSTGLSKNL